MSWLPAFKIGLWNAWILMLTFPLQPLIIRWLDKAVGTGQIYKKLGDVQGGNGQKRIYKIFAVIQILLGAYSIFLPLKLGTSWFYAGLAVYLAGLVLFLTSTITVASTPPSQVFRGGMYRWSRHPGYLSICLTFTGVGIASASWVFLLLTAVLSLLLRSQAIMEERGCLAVYGNEYQEYMDRTPRWLGIPRAR
jgi:protein-S-isoprenylcysteine O-methyltransferase Ste14